MRGGRARWSARAGRLQGNQVRSGSARAVRSRSAAPALPQPASARRSTVSATASAPGPAPDPRTGSAGSAPRRDRARPGSASAQAARPRCAAPGRAPSGSSMSGSVIDSITRLASSWMREPVRPGHPAQPLEGVPRRHPPALAEHPDRLLDGDPGRQRVLELPHRRPQPDDLVQVTTGRPRRARAGNGLRRPAGQQGSGRAQSSSTVSVGNVGNAPSTLQPVEVLLITTSPGDGSRSPAACRPDSATPRSTTPAPPPQR